MESQENAGIDSSGFNLVSNYSDDLPAFTSLVGHHEEVESAPQSAEWVVMGRKRKKSDELDTVSKRREFNENAIETPNSMEQSSGTEAAVIIDDGASRNSSKRLGYTETKTMRANNELTIIISPSGENSKSFTTDPVGLAQGLRNSPFHKINKKDLRVNRRANIVAVELYTGDENEIESLLEVTNIGKWMVNCYLPRSRTTDSIYGVVKGIDQTVGMEELKELTQDDNIKNMMRLPSYRNGVKQESTAIRIQFNEQVKQLPSFVKLGYIRYKVFPYVAPPLRCYNCQRIGHLAKNCKADPRCLICSGKHCYEECQNKSQENFKCANCNGSHKANSKECKTIKNATKVQKLIAEGKTFKEARESVLNEDMNPVIGLGLTSQGNSTYPTSTGNVTIVDGDIGQDANAVIIQADVHKSQGSYYSIPSRRADLQYSQAVKSTPNIEKEERESNREKVDYQTIMKTILPEIKNTVAEIINNAITKIYTAVANLLTEVSALNLNSEGLHQRKLLMASSIRSHLGNEYCTHVLEKIQTGHSVETTPLAKPRETTQKQSSKKPNKKSHESQSNSNIPVYNTRTLNKNKTKTQSTKNV